jgi:LysR family nitrogen assimilation transcriptional regulator
MDVRQLRYFVEVVEAKSFTRAAERVHVAQPALGFQVRKLEDELGVELLHRHSRGVEPTEAGQALLRHAYAVLRQIDLARQELMDLSGPPRGEIALGITPTASALLATRLVQECTARYPGISLKLVEGLSEDVMRWLDESRVDLGFTYNPDAVKGIPTDPLMREDLYFLAPAEKVPNLAKTITLAAACRHALILPSRPHGSRMLVEEAAAAHGITVDVRLEVDSVATIRELVEAGVGCTALPLGAVRDGVDSGRLAAARISRPRITRTLHLGFRPSGPPSAAGNAIHRVIQDVAAERIEAGGGYWRAAKEE